MEFDNPGAAEPWGGEDNNRSPHSEFSGSETNQADKKLKKEKNLLGTKKKEKEKEKKKEK